MVAATPIGARVARPRLTDVELFAWIAQAEAGARLEYHCGFLGIDVTPVISTLPEPERRQLADLGQAALGAFEKGLVIETSGADDEVVKVLAPLTTPEDTFRKGLDILIESAREVSTSTKMAAE